MATLYEISNELAAILGDADDELAEDVAERLQKLEMAFESKIEGVLQVRQGVLSDADALKEEAERLLHRADALARRAEWLKGYVLSAMQQTGVKNVSTLTFSASVCKSPLKVELADGEDIPFEYAKEETKISFDRKKALDDFKAGKTLPIGVSVSQGEHLKIS